MSLDVWFREDVIRILAAVLEVRQSAARAMPALDTEHAAVYQRGFVDAIKAVAVGFGIAPVSKAEPKKPTTIDNGWR